jgi:TPR repeat protein
MCLNYAWGIGVEKDIEKARYWFLKGEKYTEEVLREKAENGDIKSQGIMARLCGILQDDEGELYWIKRTADQGHFYAIYLLSDRYFHRGDFEESKRLMLILAKQSKSSTVFYDCGRAHERTGDIKGAIYWYKRVIRKGDSNVEVAKIALKRMEKKLKIND